MRIIVIGAGIGGLAAALTLRRAGLQAVQVFEQAAELREVGAGIQISPNASRILNRLGLEEPMRRAGVRPRSIVIRRWDDGRELARQPLADACERNFGAPYYNFHRAGSARLFFQPAVPAGVLHLDHRCVGLTQHADRVEVQFHNGATADADVVVGADGIHSTVRKAAMGPESPRFSADVVIAGGSGPPIALRISGLEVTANVWWGPEHHFVHYYVGAGARYHNWGRAHSRRMAGRVVDRQGRGGRRAQGVRRMASAGPRAHRLS